MGITELDVVLKEVIEKKGWLRELEEKIAQAEIEKEEMIFRIEQEKQEKLELERKAEQEKQDMIHKMIEDGVSPEKVREWMGCK